MNHSVDATDMVDRPFALPPDSVEIVLDLPFPPSTNRIWRGNGKHVYRAPQYLKWMSSADILVTVNNQFPRHRKINGPFEVQISLSSEHGRGDGDNRIKPLLDWLQSRDIVRNDKDCRRGSWAWVSREMAPAGCRITLRSLA